MFRRLFRESNEIDWHLNPKKYPEGSKENHTGKVILPQTVLADLLSSQIELPYTFRISANDDISYTHAGVQEFTGEECNIVLPEWMYNQLALDGSPVKISCVSLPKGQFIKLLPQCKEFLEIENPKIALENSLRHYQVLSAGDTISLYFEDEFKPILFTVSEISPSGEGISIIDTDLEVDFLPPADYKEEIPLDGNTLLKESNGISTLMMPDMKHPCKFGVIFPNVPEPTVE
ncbi:ubiquitin fusion degradation protein 1 [Nematocida sp. AWRm80]|nr:ubiquitin fusion degradation protein 1 [Nematocida sp. AWRm80]